MYKDSIQNDLDNNPKIKYNLNWVTMDDENGNQAEKAVSKELEEKGNARGSQELTIFNMDRD